MNALLVIGTFIFIYRAISRVDSAPETHAAAIITALVFSVVQAAAFMAGGWWNVIGYAAYVFAMGMWIQMRNTTPIDSTQECEALLNECDDLLTEIKGSHPKPIKLP